MKQAVILAAGEGQRLRPFTVNKPKAMISLADKPLIGYIVDALVSSGVRDIVIVVGYHKETIMDYFGSGESRGITITYAVQDKQLGTAHALKQVADAAADEFIVLPGDNLIDEKTLTDILEAPAPVVLGKRVTEPSRYGVLIAANGMVQKIAEKPDDAPSHTVSTGIYKFSRDVFTHIGTELDIPAVLNGMIRASIPVNLVITEEAWQDIVYPWDILSLNEYVLKRLPPSTGGTIHQGVTIKGTVSVGSGSVIYPNTYIDGPAIIGNNCVIGPGAYICGATSIGDNVTIKPFSEVNRCVVGADCRLETGVIIQDSVIDSGCNIGARFAATSDVTSLRINGGHHHVDVGVMVGAGCRIGSGVVAMPGTIIGNGCKIQPLKVISGLLPDDSLVY
jgi:glucose-1-phosphate thymidylyltransferase